MLPRFCSSALGSELCHAHISAVLSTAPGANAFKALDLNQSERDALEFWLSAHAAASSTAADLPARCQQVYEQFAPKMPLFEVPVAEVQRIESLLAAAKPDIFLTAQARARAAQPLIGAPLAHQCVAHRYAALDWHSSTSADAPVLATPLPTSRLAPYLLLAPDLLHHLAWPCPRPR